MTSNEIKYSISEIEHMGNGGMIERVNPDKLAAFLHETLERIEKLELPNKCFKCGKKEMYTLCEEHHVVTEPTPPPVAEEWPKKGDVYWWIMADDINDLVQESKWCYDEIDHDRREFLGVYRTRKEAQDMAEKIKSFVKQWR